MAQVYVIAGFLEFYFAHREREDCVKSELYVGSCVK